MTPFCVWNVNYKSPVFKALFVWKIVILFLVTLHEFKEVLMQITVPKSYMVIIKNLQITKSHFILTFNINLYNFQKTVLQNGAAPDDDKMAS